MNAAPTGALEDFVTADVSGSWAWNELAELRQRVSDLEAVSIEATVRDMRAVALAALAPLKRGEKLGAPFPVERTDVADDCRTVERSVLFDAAWYLETYDDVALAGDDPAAHYALQGWRDGRWPSPIFDPGAYLAANRDVADANINPLLHYERSGRFERRPLSPSAAAGAAQPGLQQGAIVKIAADLRSHAEFLDFTRTCPAAFDEESERKVLRHVLEFGTRSRFQGEVSALHTQVIGTDLREHLVSAGLNSRQRAVADLVVELLADAGVGEHEARVYGHEAITHFAKLMRARFDRFIGSEYAPTFAQQRAIFPFLHNDVCQSRFPDRSFDIIFSCDVLEHVHDRDALLREAARTLENGGSLVATFPFDFDQPKGWQLAELRDGELRHLIEEPIYHGNPMDPSGGSLVFEIPGWDIVDRGVAAGFRDSRMRFICDAERGIAATPQGPGTPVRGVFVLVCTK